MKTLALNLLLLFIFGCMFRVMTIAIFKYCYDSLIVPKGSINMNEITIEVIGPEPACMRCQAARKAVEKAAGKLEQTGLTVKIEKVNIMSKETASKYGVIVSPAIAINGVVKFMGRVPSEDEIAKLIEEAAK